MRRLGMSEIHILVIDDDPAMQIQVEDRLFAMGYSCEKSDNMSDAKEWIDKQRFDLVVLDLEIPARYGMMTRIDNGKLFLGWLREKFPREELPVIVITAHGLMDTDLCTEVFCLEANDFIKKPFVSLGHTFEDAVKKCLKTKSRSQVADIWISRTKRGRTVCWSVVAKDGTVYTAEIQNSSQRNKVLEVIYLKQNDGQIPHKDFMDGCVWGEFEYFKPDKKGGFSAKRGPLKNHRSRIENALHIGMDIVRDGVNIKRP